MSVPNHEIDELDDTPYCGACGMYHWPNDPGFTCFDLEAAIERAESQVEDR